MGRDGPVERNSLGNAASWDARRGAHGSPGAAAPGAFWELFCGEKFPAGGRRKTADANWPSRLRRPLTRRGRAGRPYGEDGGLAGT